MSKAGAILLVEDDADISDAVAAAVQDRGEEVQVASNGQEALDRLHESRELPRFILLDLMMPVMDGWQFRDAQRNEPRLMGIPVVVISAHVDIRRIADELGALTWLRKPPDVIDRTAPFSHGVHTPARVFSRRPAFRFHIGASGSFERKEAPMSHAMNAFTDTTTTPIERAATTRHAQSLLQRAALTLLMAAAWGVAAGAARPVLALLNIYKVPMVLSLSVLVTLPAVLVARSLLHITISPIELLTAVVTGLERGALVLVGFAPLIAVYAFTSQWASPVLAQLSGGLALVCGLVSVCVELTKLGEQKGALLLLSVITAVALCLSTVQLISLATPVLPVHTAFGAGIDGMFHR